MALTYTTIREMAKEAYKAAYVSAFSIDTNRFQIILELENANLKSRRIEIGASSEPIIQGETVIGWSVELVIAAVTNMEDYTKAEHEEIAGKVELMNLASDLVSRLESATLPSDYTGKSFNVGWFEPGACTPEIDPDAEERRSEYRLTLHNCFIS